MMNYFAKIVEGTVNQVIVVSSSDCGGLQFPSSEPVGQTFIASLGIEGAWLQTSETGQYRGRYAGLGYVYDLTADVYIAPKPYPSWILDDKYDWQSPTPYPNDEKIYAWNEASLTWVVVVG